MIAVFFGVQVAIPETMIARYTAMSEPLKMWEFRKQLEKVRDSTYEVMDLISKDLNVLAEPKVFGDLMRALAMREALRANGVLHDD